MYSVKKGQTVDTPPYKPWLEEKLACALVHLPLLEPYWKKNLQEDHNRKSWFHHIADELGLSFSGVAKIEREYRPAKFTPDREPNN